MQREKTSTSYALELTADESGLVLDDLTLYHRLDKLPIYSIDYDGHFGPQIEYTVNVEDDTEELHEQVVAVCKQRLNEMDDIRLRRDLR